VKAIVYRLEDGNLMFWCPGCQCGHKVWIKADRPGGPVWTWNGSLDRPTFEPSLLIRQPQFGKSDRVCHIFVRDGQIQFLGDCTHALKNQTVPMELF
jgi:hypothetical protein